MDQPASDDQISFLKAIPDGRYRRGVRYPQWFLLLMAIRSILSGQDSLVDIKRCAKHHQHTRDELLRTDFGKSPSDSTFRLLLAKLDMSGFESLLRDCMAAQQGVTEQLDTLMCDGKMMLGLIAQTDSVAGRFIAQVSLYSQTLGVGIASGESQALRQLLKAVDLGGVLVQADALHANRPISSTSPSAAPTS